MQPVALQTQQTEAGQLEERSGVDVLQEVVIQVEAQQRAQARKGQRGRNLSELVIAEL